MLHHLLARDVITRLRNADDTTRCAHYPKGSLLPSKLGLHEIDDYIDRNEEQLPEMVKVRLNGRPFDVRWNARTNQSTHRQVVKNALRAGAALEIGCMEARHTLVAGVCAGLEAVYGGRACGKVLVTPHEKKSTAPRFDAGATFVVQLLGVTPWATYGSLARHPTPCMARALSPDDLERADVARTLLQPGDVLFVPPGVGHGADCTTGHSVQLVLNVVPLAAVDLLRRAIDSLAPSLESARVPVYPGGKDLQAKMETALTDLFGGLLAQTLGERMLNFGDALHPPHTAGRDLSIAAALDLGPYPVPHDAEPHRLMVRELVSRGLFNDKGSRTDPVAPSQDNQPETPPPPAD